MMMLSGTTPNAERRRRLCARSTTPTFSYIRPWDPSTSRASSRKFFHVPKTVPTPHLSSTSSLLVFLHPVRCDGTAVLANLSHDTSANSQVGRHRRGGVAGVVRDCAAAPEVDADVDDWRQQGGNDDRWPQVDAIPGHQPDCGGDWANRHGAAGEGGTGSGNNTHSEDGVEGRTVRKRKWKHTTGWDRGDWAYRRGDGRIWRGGTGTGNRSAAVGHDVIGDRDATSTTPTAVRRR